MNKVCITYSFPIYQSELVTFQDNTIDQKQQKIVFIKTTHQKMKVTQKLPDHHMLSFAHFGVAEAQFSSPTQLASFDSPLGL